MTDNKTDAAKPAATLKPLTLDEILAADKARRVVPVDVPEWGGTVCVREMTAAERESFDASIADADGRPLPGSVRVKAVLATLCDPAGTLLLTAAHADAIGAKGDAGLDRVFDATAKLNRLRKSDRDEEKKG